MADSGTKVIIAENGKIAIEKLEKDKDIDIVLMDVMMPAMDGYEATAKIRENPGFEKLPIISLTAKVMPEDKAKRSLVFLWDKQAQYNSLFPTEQNGRTLFALIAPLFFYPFFPQF